MGGGPPSRRRRHRFFCADDDREAEKFVIQRLLFEAGGQRFLERYATDADRNGNRFFENGRVVQECVPRLFRNFFHNLFQGCVRFDDGDPGLLLARRNQEAGKKKRRNQRGNPAELPGTRTRGMNRGIGSQQHDLMVLVRND